MKLPLRLGTRGSPLALTQARMVIAALSSAHGLAPDAIVIVPIRTSGDRIQDRALADVGGKALWTKELDRALFDGDIDFAVHSMKDVETVRPDRIVIAAMLERADARDRLIGAPSVGALRHGARVGTSSPRRAAQLARARRDIRTVLFRGNVATRLARLEAGEADATLLAAAGLDRLGHPAIGHAIPVSEMLPAPAQGAVGIETLADARDIRALLAVIDHCDTSRAVLAERAFLAVLGADCRSPVAALMTREPAGWRLQAEILSVDGTLGEVGSARVSSDDMADHAGMAGELAHVLLGRAPSALRNLFAA